MTRPVTISWNQLAEVQGSAADGGMVHSDWYGRDKIQTGHLVRGGGGWAVVTARYTARLHAGPVLVIGYRGLDGEYTERTLTEYEGMEVRLDTRIDVTGLTTLRASL